MTTTPYRTSARPSPERTSEPPAPASLVGVALFLWVSTVARVTLAVTHGEPTGQELVLAGLVLLAAPLVVWRELVTRARAR
jgi:hypothetical protein